MTITLVNDRRVQRDTKASTHPATPSPMTRKRREWGVGGYRIAPRWPAAQDADGVLALPPGLARWAALSSRPGGRGPGGTHVAR
jgi:hypothetical protein